MSILNWFRKKRLVTSADNHSVDPPTNTATYTEAERLANSAAAEERMQSLDPNEASAFAFSILQVDFHQAMQGRPGVVDMLRSGHRASDYHPYRAKTYHMALDILAKWNSNDPKVIEYCNRGRGVVMMEFVGDDLDS